MVTWESGWGGPCLISQAWFQHAAISASSCQSKAAEPGGQPMLGVFCRKDTSTDLRFLQTQFTIFVLPPYSWFIVLKQVVQPPRSQRLAPCNLEKHPEAFRRSLGQIATLRAHGSLFAEDSINAVWDAKTNRKPNLQSMTSKESVDLK